MKCPVWLLKRLTRSDINRIPFFLKWLFPTLHFCCEWDGLAIDKHCPEFDCCSCLEKP